MNDIPAWVASIFGAGGVGYLILKSIRDYMSGKAESEKQYNQRMIREAAANDERADKEALERRVIQEYASRLRRILTENGITPPPWPEGHDQWDEWSAPTT